MEPGPPASKQSSNKSRGTSAKIYHLTRHQIQIRKRDPFRELPDDVVRIIIDRLSATDTENLRRVSKSWRVASEFFNAKQALRAHFPKYEIKRFETNGQANLEYRKLLYHHQSLCKGYVKRLLEYKDVTFWSINNDRLAYADKTGNICVRELRDHNDVSIDVTRTLHMPKIDRHLGPVDVVGLWVLNDGDIVVQKFPTGDTASTTSKMKSKQTANPGLLTRLRPSEPHFVVWEIYGQPLLCADECSLKKWRGHGDAKPMYAVGKDRIYEMRHDGPRKYKSSEWVSSLLVRWLDKPYRGLAIKHYAHSGSHNWNDCHMVLTGNEKSLILKNTKGVVRIVSTATGDDQNFTGNISNLTAPNTIITFIVPTHSSRFWEHRFYKISRRPDFQCSVYVHRYDASSDSFTRELIWTDPTSDFGLTGTHDKTKGVTLFVTKCGGPDKDRYMHQYQLKRWDHHMAFGVLNSKKYRSYRAMPPNEHTSMKLPDPEDSLIRRDMRIARPELRHWPTITQPRSLRLACDAESYMGMVDEYLVNYDATRGHLVILDFWPCW